MCCLAGKYISETFSYDSPFERFNEYLLRDTNYFPTASSMLNTVLQQSSAEQIIVLIGGNSVLRGFGQGKSDIWSKKLQALLGGQYKVFNFAMPTGSINMNAAVIGEALYLKGRKVILITNSLSLIPPPPDLLANWDNYIFLEALYKNLLDKNQQNRKNLNSSWVRFEEVNLAQRLNSQLFFNDLWSFIAYRYFFTVWTSMTQHSWMSARSSPAFPDADYKWTPRLKEQYEIEKDGLVHLNKLGEFAYSFKSGNAGAAQSILNLEEMLPQYLIPRTIIVLSSENPYFINRMDQKSRDRFNFSYNFIEESWKKAGYKTLRIGMEIPYQEWNDQFHFAAPAGNRLAIALTPIIFSMGKSLYPPSAK